MEKFSKQIYSSCRKYTASLMVKRAVTIYTSRQKYTTSSIIADRTERVEIISNEIIKPSSPSPNHLKTFKLSLLDQIAMHSYTPFLLLYESETTTSSDVLKKSLSETLTKYYPLAGRLKKDGITVDCGDQGVVFVEAKIWGCRVSEFLRDPKFKIQRSLYPEGFFWKESCIGYSFLAAQVTYFEGGGMVITISISHKVADGSTVDDFLSDWAAAARGEVRPPPVILATHVPSLDLVHTMAELKVEKTKTCVNKRFVFDSQKIAELKQSVVGFADKPTKVELITALLYKCAITSATGCFRNSNLIQLVNMKRRMSTHLPNKYIGNLTWYFTISNHKKSEIMNLGNLVLQLKKEMKEFRDGGENRHLEDWLMGIRESANDVKEFFCDVEVYRCSDVHSGAFYQTDFGWGNPRWVPLPDMLAPNMFILFSTPDGDGIEAVVSLEEEHMRRFQTNQQLLQFSSTI